MKKKFVLINYREFFILRSFTTTQMFNTFFMHNLNRYYVLGLKLNKNLLEFLYPTSISWSTKFCNTILKVTFNQ